MWFITRKYASHKISSPLFATLHNYNDNTRDFARRFPLADKSFHLIQFYPRFMFPFAFRRNNNLHDLYFLPIAPCCFFNLTPSGMLRRTLSTPQSGGMALTKWLGLIVMFSFFHIGLFPNKQMHFKFSLNFRLELWRTRKRSMWFTR